MNPGFAGALNLPLPLLQKLRSIHGRRSRESVQWPSGLSNYTQNRVPRGFQRFRPFAEGVIASRPERCAPAMERKKANRSQVRLASYLYFRSCSERRSHSPPCVLWL